MSGLFFNNSVAGVATTSAPGLQAATSFAALAYAASIGLDMAVYDQQYRTITLTGPLTFTTANLANGRMVSLRLIASGGPWSFTFPAGWVFVGTKPSSIAANKTAALSLTFYGTADTDCIAAYSAQT
jgi:hypothetical protein